MLYLFKQDTNRFFFKKKCVKWIKGSLSAQNIPGVFNKLTTDNALLHYNYNGKKGKKIPYQPKAVMQWNFW